MVNKILSLKVNNVVDDRGRFRIDAIVKYRRMSKYHERENRSQIYTEKYVFGVNAGLVEDTGSFWRKERGLESYKYYYNAVLYHDKEFLLVTTRIAHVSGSVGFNTKKELFDFINIKIKPHIVDFIIKDVKKKMLNENQAEFYSHHAAD